MSLVKRYIKNKTKTKQYQQQINPGTEHQKIPRVNRTRRTRTCLVSYLPKDTFKFRYNSPRTVLEKNIS